MHPDPGMQVQVPMKYNDLLVYLFLDATEHDLARESNKDL